MINLWKKKWTECYISKGKGLVSNLSFFIKLWGHRFLESDINIDSKEGNIFYFQCYWDYKGDHNGFHLDIALWRLGFEVEIIDSRHWNWDEDRYFLSGEEKEAVAKKN